MLISKTDYIAGGSGEMYETHLELVQREYHLYQAHNGGGPVRKDEETVILGRQQAVDIAKTILRNEGYNVA